MTKDLNSEVNKYWDNRDTNRNNLLEDLNNQIKKETDISKEKYGASQPVLRHSIAFAMNKGKELKPKNDSLLLSAEVFFDDDNEIKDFNIKATFKKGK